jgi:argonaute-like protein implicated in RNA metabolism and viral defense
MVKMLVRYITIQKNNANYSIKDIVIHRDGRLFKQEKQGILQSLQILKKNGILPEDATINIIEIPKHSMIPFRLFDILREDQALSDIVDRGNVLNPEIGSWIKFNSKEAFLCTTGREFRHDGTSKPLYIKYESGSMKIEDILEDIYFLSCLAYTKPDDCSRFPLTIKITDRRINTLGSDFDFESLDILKSENLIS